jgi:peroxiredoxin
MNDLEKNIKIFKKLNTIAVGISVDSVPCENPWAKSLKISKTGILADFWRHGGIAKALGILKEEGFSECSNFIIDKEGRLAYQKIYPITQLPDIYEIIEQLKLIEEQQKNTNLYINETKKQRF